MKGDKICLLLSSPPLQPRWGFFGSDTEVVKNLLAEQRAHTANGDASLTKPCPFHRRQNYSNNQNELWPSPVLPPVLLSVSTKKPWCQASPVRNLIIFVGLCGFPHCSVNLGCLFCYHEPSGYAWFGDGGVDHDLEWSYLALEQQETVDSPLKFSTRPRITVPVRSERTEGDITYESYQQSFSRWDHWCLGFIKDLNHPLK